MKMLAQHSTTNKQAHPACNIHKKKKVQKSRKVREILATQETQKPSTISFLMNFSLLIGVFAILAYFRPH